MTTIQQTLKQASQKLKQKKILSADLDAEVLLSFVLKKSKEFLFTYPEQKLTLAQQKKFDRLISRRITGMPVAYLTNHKEFFGLDFYVNKTVLIPRPETEILVEQAIRLIRKNKFKNIADIGSGSGAIIISLAKNLDANKKYYATDICRRALQTAKKNAARHQAKINFFQGDLLEPLKNKKLDLIATNLPYLKNSHKNLLKSPDTLGLKFEPPKALYAGKGGLDCYEKFFTQIRNYDIKAKFILIEIGDRQAGQLKKIILTLLPKAKITTIKDLCGLNRVLEIKL